MSESDPLDEIFVEKNVSLDRKILAQALKNYVTIDSSGQIEFLSPFEGLTESRKALVYLVSKKAIVAKEVDGFDDSATPKEISDMTYIGHSSAKAAVSRYLSQLVEKKGKGYAVPNRKLRKVKEILQGQESSNDNE